MRLMARWCTFKRFYFDDAFVVFAWLLALSTAIDWQIIAWKMYSYVSVTSGQLSPPRPDFEADTESYYDGSLAIMVFYSTSLWSIKIAFLLFFKRLGQNIGGGQRLLWWSIFGFTMATYFVLIGDIPYSCLVGPLPKLRATCSSDKSISFQTASLKLNCAFDVITDLMSEFAPICSQI